MSSESSQDVFLGSSIYQHCLLEHNRLLGLVGLETQLHYKVTLLTTEYNSRQWRLKRCLVPDSLGPVMLNEIYQAHKDKFHMTSPISGIYMR